MRMHLFASVCVCVCVCLCPSPFAIGEIFAFTHIIRIAYCACNRLRACAWQPTDFNASATKREQREGERGGGGVRSCAALKHAAIAARTWRLFIMRINILASVAGCVDSPATPAFALSSRVELCVRCMPGPSPSSPLCVFAGCGLPVATA